MLCAVAVVLSLGVATADGRTKHSSTTITHDVSADLGAGTFLVGGHIHSKRRPCDFFRIVKLKAHFSNGKTKLVDTDATSGGGAWAMRADLAGADRLKAVVTRAVVGFLRFGGNHPAATHHPQRRKIVCDKASVVFAAP